MISIQCEQVFPISKVGDHCPRRRGDKPVHMSTGLRWAKTGCRAEDGTRVYLETIRVGGTLCTSVEALQHFFERLSEKPVSNSQQPVQAKPPTGLHAGEQRRVEQLLTAMGV